MTTLDRRIEALEGRLKTLRQRKREITPLPRYNSKLSDADIAKIRERRKNGHLTKDLASDYGVSENLISRYTRDLSSKRVRSDARKT